MGTSRNRLTVTQKSSTTAAYLSLLAKLHELGLLNEIFESGTDNVGKQTLADEADGKIDVYNYAARFKCVPTYNVQALTRSLRSKKKIIEVTIELSEQNIKVAGRGTDLRSAEVAAALRFKVQAERYHAERGEGSIIINDSTALTTANSRNLFEYYRILHPRASVVVNCETINRRAYGAEPKKAQVILDGRPIGEPVEMTKKTKAEDLAFLTAAIVLTKEHPDLLSDFAQASKSSKGDILRPVPVGDMVVDISCVLTMRETLQSARDAGLPDEADHSQEDNALSEASKAMHRYLTPLRKEQANVRNLRMKSARAAYLQNPRLAELRKKRSELPMNQYSEKVLNMVTENPYCIIVGATGSGKTTQVPQILLEEAIAKGRGSDCNIICTQPRRIAATSVARRVAEERAERLQDSVGYQVRFDSKLPKTRGSISFCTIGILLRQLQHAPDDVMDSVSHLIIDEVHERSIETDFLLVILKKVMVRRAAAGQSIPKIVLMSATIDTDLFASYFGNSIGGKDKECPIVSVPGRTFPVEKQYLDTIVDQLRDSYPASALQLLRSDVPTRDYLEASERFCQEQPVNHEVGASSANQADDFVIDWKKERKISAEGEIITTNEKDDALIPFGLVALTVAHISKISDDGAILVFLPGLEEITKVRSYLTESNPLNVNFNNESKFKICLLHSSIPTGQTEVFDAVPSGCRKIILATNIAETSITITDVKYVVDTGKVREKQYDNARRITKLVCSWISKSNSKQRAGRAGRIQNGNYYALFPKARYDSMRAIGLPEMLRSDLQETCLAIKAQAFTTPIREFLAGAIEPPPERAVDASVVNLQQLDALTWNEEITPLGRVLAQLPVHPSLGKMIVLGVIFRCLDPMLVIGAAASERQIFVSPLEHRAQAHAAKREFVQGSGSDHIALVNAVRELRARRDQSGERAMKDCAVDNFIHIGAFRTIDNTARQIEELLVQNRLIPSTHAHARNNSEFGPSSLNENSNKVPLIKALTLAGLHPNLAVKSSGRSLRTPGEIGAMIHPSSVNAPRDKDKDGDSIRQGTLFSYSAMAHSTDGRSIFLRDTTESTPLMATLFGGKIINRSHSNIIEMDGWLPWYVKSQDRSAASTIVEFRQALERLLSVAFRDLAGKDNRSENGEHAYLADDRVRSLFAAGLVDVLDLNVKGADVGMSRRWGSEVRFPSNPYPPQERTDTDPFLRWNRRDETPRIPKSPYARKDHDYTRPNGLGFYNELMASRNIFSD